MRKGYIWQSILLISDCVIEECVVRPSPQPSGIQRLRMTLDFCEGPWRVRIMVRDGRLFPENPAGEVFPFSCLGVCG